jgi:hypothetical protein
VIEAVKNEPSDEAFARATAQMLQTIDHHRAEARVQQLANGHGPSDTFTIRGVTEINYQARFDELDRSETQLRDGVPESVIARAEQLLAEAG